jgi:methylenetetrahydrofolate dehydrogenase (NADP+) / methenyltetrahydrofolate cyclohydrolase
MSHEPSTAQLMDGTTVSKQLFAETAQRARWFSENAGRRPCLAAVLIGEDPASVTYVKMKRNRADKAGIDSELSNYPPPQPRRKRWRP